MGVRRLGYSQALENAMAKGKSTAEAHKIAVEKSRVGVKKVAKKKKKKSALARAARLAAQLAKGKRWKMSAKAEKAQKALGKKKPSTLRTRAIEKGLRQGGLTEKQIRRLRGK